jgi:NADH-quinone oxidoreductase subunit J
MSLINLIFWLCSAVALISALLATFLNSIRHAVLSLWICGLAVGGLFLSQGAELLAIVQWVISTLAALSFIFYSIMLGEYHARNHAPFKAKLTAAILPVLAGLGFAGVIGLGSYSLIVEQFSFEAPSVVSHDLVTLGNSLMERQFLSLQILGLTLFLVVVGAGIVARSELERKS